MHQAEITHWRYCALRIQSSSPAPPHPSQWNDAKIQLWLIDNPISDPDDCAFVLAAVDEHTNVAAWADVERNKTVSELFNKN